MNRNKIFSRVLLALALGQFFLPLQTGQAGEIAPVPGWKLVWHDEFDGDSIDLEKWTPLDRKDSYNEEKQYYHPTQVMVAAGVLKLNASKLPRQGKPYQSGLVTSNRRFGPGRFEARIDLPTSKGMWPAFWLNANHVSWPQGGEIDILENRGHQPEIVSSAYHWQTGSAECCDHHQFVFQEYSALREGKKVDFHQGFHTYACEWDANYLQFFVDGMLHYTVEQTAERPLFATPKNIILNLAVGGKFGGDPDETTVWPQTMKVDYVRYWSPAKQ